MDHPKRILIVDDEPINRELLQEMLRALGHETEGAGDGIEALNKLALGFDLVLLDGMMPRLDGFEVARRIRLQSHYPDVPIIMVTALNTREDRLRAVESGANDFIAKPIDRTELRVRTSSMLQMKEAQDIIKRHSTELEAAVERRTAELRQALGELASAQRRTYEAHLDTVQRLAVAAEYKDSYTSGHIRRVQHYCALLGRLLNLAPREIEILYHASALHDVGKIAVPDSILLRKGDLTPKQWEIMKRHTTIGAHIVSGSSSELLEAGKVMALSHHEKWDGSGYPVGLEGARIPLYGRICAVADVFDTLTNNRPYRKSLTNAQALKIMEEGRGSHFDPEIVDLFLAHQSEFLAIQAQFPDQAADFLAELADAA